MKRESNLESIIEGVVTGVAKAGPKASSTPANSNVPAEGKLASQSSTSAGNSIKAKAGTKPMPAVATDVETKNKDAAKVAHQTKKAKEPQDAPRTGDASAPLQGSSNVKEEEEYYDEELLENEEEEYLIPETQGGRAKAIYDILRATDDLDEDRFVDVVSAILSEEEDEDDKPAFLKKKGKKDDEDDDEDDDDDDDDEEAVEEATYESIVAARARITADDIDIDEDVEALMATDETLSEEFKVGAKTIFEAAVVSKVNQEIDRLAENFVVEVQYERDLFEEELNSRVDKYLTYAVEEWMKENTLAIDRGIRTEVSEEFMLGLRDLFTEHYISIPDDRVDVVDALAEKVEELEDALNESIENQIELHSQIDVHERFEILNQLSDGLADTEVEKLAGLAEGVEFEDEHQYATAITTLKESYFPRTVRRVADEEGTDELLSESLQPDAPRGPVSHYADAISRTSK